MSAAVSVFAQSLLLVASLPARAEYRIDLPVEMVSVCIGQPYTGNIWVDWTQIGELKWKIWHRTASSLDARDFEAAKISHFFEIIAINLANRPYLAGLFGAKGEPMATIEVPAQTLTPTIFRAPWNPKEERVLYRVGTQAREESFDSGPGLLNVQSARMVVELTNPRRANIQIPITAGANVLTCAASDIYSPGDVYRTRGRRAEDSLAPFHLLWKKSLAGFPIAKIIDWAFEAQVSRFSSAVLFNWSKNSPVGDTDTSVAPTLPAGAMVSQRRVFGDDARGFENEDVFEARVIPRGTNSYGENGFLYRAQLSARVEFKQVGSEALLGNAQALKIGSPSVVSGRRLEIQGGASSSRRQAKPAAGQSPIASAGARVRSEE